MGDLDIHGSKWPLVEVGRVVVLDDDHPDAGKLATIVEIIDHKRVLIDGPNSDESQAVERQAVALAKCRLSKLVVDGVPRGARRATVKKYWDKAEIESKWKESNWFKKRVQRERRRALTDFDRYKVMRLRKRTRFAVRKALSEAKASA